MEVEIFIHAQWNKYSKTYDYSTYSSDMSDYGYVLLEKQKVHFESPTEKDLQVKTVAILRRQADKVRAKAFVEAQVYEQEADELLCLEFEPEQKPFFTAEGGEFKKVEASDDIPF